MKRVSYIHFLIIIACFIFCLSGCQSSDSSQSHNNSKSQVSDILNKGMQENNEDSVNKNDNNDVTNNNNDDSENKDSTENKDNTDNKEDKDQVGQGRLYKDTDIDVDLTKLNSTMVYSEVYNMMTAPQEYTDKIIKMRGQFAMYQDPDTGKNYFAVIIQDATQCCQQGIEYVLSGNKVYPDDYPELGSEVTVEGIFHTYQENEYQFCELREAEFVK